MLAGRRGLADAVAPKSIAIVGASENPNKIGGRPLFFLSRFGYAGPVYPINPKRETVQGYRSIPSVSALPEPVDLAVIAIPGAEVPEAVAECAALGVKNAVIFSSGFRELEGEDGRASERRIVSLAREANMRIIGPNSQGLANFATGAVSGFSTMFLEERPEDGPVAVLSQSGAMAGLVRRQGFWDNRRRELTEALVHQVCHIRPLHLDEASGAV